MGKCEAARKGKAPKETQNVEKIIVLLNLSFFFWSIIICFRTSTLTLGVSITLDVLFKLSVLIDTVKHVEIKI